ncbi:metal-dependent hydrolase family protein [Actinoalloteichus hymeniacidonis]|uniref:Amidohydrolase, imidazolonepropionase n=1 Tax=Actinoalloteichus hymeniacidonis TaxID=340345 RepID=A0AAC9MYW9_9PSEU|nr:amidohydrolase family protein [Actinoalloteichus hymeniacidonis]AOS63765.1 amidohydrolase, imidazolonepropionase [Actinoalloteichus hymeniacidonis]MBB5908181.1 imidazolonepropionase-like amidohydrolase [Actinoalloteichus hymeniacidonis]
MTNARNAATGTITVVGARIFDGERILDDASEISVVDGAIAEVGKDLPRTGEIFDAGGRTVSPGLIDAHFHAYGTSIDVMAIESSPLSYVSLVGADRLTRALFRGFTTVRDVAGGDAGLAKAIDAGYVTAPRYLYTGPALSQTGGHGDPRQGDLDHCVAHAHLSEVVDGPDSVRRAVRERFRTGAHAIKIMASGGVVSPTDPIQYLQYHADEVRAATEEAARRGSYVAAHAYPPEAIIHAVENGVRTIEHGNLLDERAAAIMAEQGAYLIPTLVAYDAMERRGASIGLSDVGQIKNRQVLAAGKEAIRIARAAGVPVGFGSDLMGELEDDQLIGLRLQVDVDGVLETLRAATTVNARAIQRPDLGKIEQGHTGDLVIFDGDPFTDASLLWEETKPRTVIQRGVLR